MRILRGVVLGLFVAMVLAFGFFYMRQQNKEKNAYPEIIVEPGVLEVSVSDDMEALLQGVSAQDAEDGDLTGHLVIESISQFLTKGECNVCYAVCDSTNHVTKAERRMRYTDYTSPVFYLKESLCYSTLESEDLLSVVGATDVIDGDISDNVIISASDYVADEAGVYHISVEVTNSMGDTIETTLPVYVEERKYSAPVIELTQYLLYLKVGESYDVPDFIENVYDYNGEELENVRFSYDSGVRSNKPGVYTIHYYADCLREDGSVNENIPTGHAVLIVVVEE